MLDDTIISIILFHHADGVTPPILREVDRWPVAWKEVWSQRIFAAKRIRQLDLVDTALESEAAWDVAPGLALGLVRRLREFGCQVSLEDDGGVSVVTTRRLTLQFRDELTRCKPAVVRALEREAKFGVEAPKKERRKWVQT
jgi:hypothetical protein